MARYTPDELEQWLYVETIADTAAPSTAELAAGVNLFCDSMSYSGFTFTVGTTEVPDGCSRFTKTIPGRASAEASSIQFYMDDDPAAVIRDSLPVNGVGHVVRVHPVSGAPAPLTAGTVVEVWPVAITGNNVDTPTLGEAAKFTVGFAHPDTPEQFAVVDGAS